jgi:cleavage stimulation factor subunit 2
LTSVRLIRDKETQKPKGFGFVDYADMAGAVAAMRTLQGADLDGQKLRLDWADRVAPRGVDNLRSVTQLPQEDALTAGINGLTAEQLNELLIRLQKAVGQAPGHASQVLEQHPAMLFALWHALLLLGYHDPLLPVSPADAREMPLMAGAIDTALREAAGGIPSASAPPPPAADLGTSGNFAPPPPTPNLLGSLRGLPGNPGPGLHPGFGLLPGLGLQGGLGAPNMQLLSQLAGAQVDQLTPEMRANMLRMMTGQR